MEKHKSDGWKPGDLGLCIKVGPWTDPNALIKSGQYVTVEAVETSNFPSGRAKGLVLKEDKTVYRERRTLYRADRFIKINPEDLDDSEEVRKQLEEVL